MKHQISRFINTFFIGLFLFCLGISFVETASAQRNMRERQQEKRNFRKTSNDLLRALSRPNANQQNVDIIIQLNAKASSMLQKVINRNGAHRIKATFFNFNYVALSVPASMV